MKDPVVTSSKDIMGGTPVFAGTRVPTQTLIDVLAADDSIDDFLEGFPTVSREQAVEFLRTINSQETKKHEFKSSYLTVWGYLGLAIFGLILAFYVPELIPEATILPVLMLAGFFTFFFSAGGLLAFLGRAVSPQTTNRDLAAWELDRSDGKERYIKKFLLRWAFIALPVIGVLSLQSIFNNGLPIGRIVFLTFLVAITLLSMIGIANRLWNTHEQEHSAALEISLRDLDKKPHS